MAFDTPILLIAWRRPDTTKLVIDAMRKIKPTCIYVACDGPKPDDAKQALQVSETRELIDREIDWLCDLKKNYREANLGCRTGVASAISWFFENVSEGIILEDDVVPSQDFFFFCRELLERYRFDSRIAQISGLSRGAHTFPAKASYSFSRFNHIWGWATWARAWRYYDDTLSSLEEVNNKRLLRQIGTCDFEKYWSACFRQVADREVDTWDYVWSYSVLMQGMVAVIPKHNLVQNVGFSESATHTKSAMYRELEAPRKISFPLIHPQWVIPDDSVGNDLRYNTLNAPLYKIPLISRGLRRLARMMKGDG